MHPGANHRVAGNTLGHPILKGVVCLLRNLTVGEDRISLKCQGVKGGVIVLTGQGKGGVVVWMSWSTTGRGVAGGAVIVTVEMLCLTGPRMEDQLLL